MHELYPRVASFLRERLRVRPKASFDKLFLAAGKHCGYWDFLPLCLRDMEKAQETLVRIT